MYATKVSKQIKNEGSVASGSRREEAAGFSQQEASQAMGSLGGWNTKMRKETKRLLESLCTQELYGTAFLLERLRKINGEGCLRKEIASGLEYLTDFQITIFTI